MLDTVNRAKNRQEIIRVAARQFRRDGLDAVGVRQLMAEAGRTHGGFYAYFPSKAELAAQAIESASNETRSMLVQSVAKLPSVRKLEALIDNYLCETHRQLRDKGCAAAALGSEIARQPDNVRDSFTRSLRLTVEVFATVLPPGGTSHERLMRGYAVFSLLMGSLQLSRSVTNAKASKEIISSGRKDALALANLPWASNKD